jgi:hypothetical protein
MKLKSLLIFIHVVVNERAGIIYNYYHVCMQLTYTRVHTTRNGQIVHCPNSLDSHVIQNSSSAVPIHNFKQVGVA